ncbi:MAG: peptidyl-prolyl cis-trans isomerase [Gemmatimonadetes bacterium]|nr:peptidyl-prolyl cis-trans isomerase [Gemmatimonadota bacterium]MCB9519085.1 peptidyl-prolyl cis-trans isomerase [Gemmatimonadales bacterium]
MRRTLRLTVPLTALLMACSGDAFSGDPELAAKAAGQDLRAERVAEIMTSVKGVTINPEAADFVSRLWVDYTLFAQAVADNSLTTDSAMVANAMWVDVAEITAGHWIDTLIARRAEVTPERVDSAYAAGGVRVLQHVLVQVDPSATEVQRNAARRKIDGIAARAKGGADFGTLALDNSDDVATKVDSGFLPPSPRGAFVPPFDSAAWLLEPGEISDVVVTSYGFHVIKRGTEAQAKARMTEWLQTPLIQQMEQRYFVELDSVNKVELARDAAAKAREAIGDLAKAGSNNGTLATYADGKLTVAQFARWIRAMTQDPTQGPQQLEQMKQVPDSMLEAGVRQVANRYLMLRDAEREGITITPEEWGEVQAQFAMSVDTIKASIGLGPDVIDPSASEADRRRAAALRVDQFFDRMTTGESRLRLLPGMLAWTLRERSNAAVNPAGVQRAVDLAKARLAADTSNAVPNDVAPVAPVRPAPGGPPVSGDN